MPTIFPSRLQVPFVVAAFFFSVPMVVNAETNLVQQHIKAVGGQKAIEAIQTISSRFKVSGTSAFGPASGTASEFLNIKDKSGHTKLNLIGFEQKARWDAKSGFREDTATGKSQIPNGEFELRKLTNSVSVIAHISSIHSPAAFYAKGKQDFEGKTCNVLMLHGSTMEFFLDTKTHHLVGYTASGMTVSFSNFRPVGDLQLPHKRVIKIAAQKLTLVYVATEISLNKKTENGSGQETPATKAAIAAVTGFIKSHDKNQDGSIDRDEAPEDLQLYFAKYDLNGDQKIDFQEATKLAKYLDSKTIADATADTPPKKKLNYTAKQLIGFMDKNLDGKIGKSEASDQLKPYFDDVDTNKDGLIDENEAKVMVQHANR